MPSTQQQGATKAPALGQETSAAVLEPLETLETLGAGRLPSALIDEMTALRERARQRLAHSHDHVVVAVAGGTGSGKSSLVNALVGQTLSAAGVRRPTTERAQAVPIGDAPGAEPLLDWLQVEERHPLPAEGMLAPLRGAVLLDLPDVDSTVREHAQVAERLIKRCDLLLWVMDPLKYAQALTHKRYFARLAHHAGVLLVVLNHIDRLDEADRETDLAHLRDLLAEQDLAAAQLLPTAATTGEGIAELRQRISAVVRERRAPRERIRADVADLMERSAAQLPPPETLVLDTDALASHQREAVNEAALLASADSAYRRAAGQATGSPLRGLLGRAVARRFGRPTEEPRQGQEPPRPSVAEPRVRQGLLEAVSVAADQLPEPAAGRVRQQAASAAAALTEDLRQRLAELPLEPSPRRWWSGVRRLRLAAEMVAAFGFVWLAGRGLPEWLGLPPVPTPALLGEITWPFALLAGGVLASVALAGAARPLISVGARRHVHALRQAVRQDAAATDVAPLAELRQALADCRQLSEHAHQGAAAGDP